MQGADLLYEMMTTFPMSFGLVFTAQLDAEGLNGSEFNLCLLFSDAKVWPRGFPLEAIRQSVKSKNSQSEFTLPFNKDLLTSTQMLMQFTDCLLGKKLSFKVSSTILTS